MQPIRQGDVILMPVVQVENEIIRVSADVFWLTIAIACTALLTHQQPLPKNQVASRHPALFLSTSIAFYL